jgi:endoglucanase
VVAKHRQADARTPRWPILTSLLASALAVSLVGWTVNGATGQWVVRVGLPAVQEFTGSAGPRTPAPAPGSPTSPSATPRTTPSTAPSATTTSAADASPIAGSNLFVQDGGPAEDQVRLFEQQQKVTEANAIRKIADQPVALWFVDDGRGYAVRAKDLVDQATAAGKLPVLVTNFLPNHGCADATAGAKDANAYHTWVAAIVDAIGDRPAVVILEPGAVAQAVSGCVTKDTDVTARYGMLADAVDLFDTRPQVQLYLDAGNPTWTSDIAKLATGLTRAGVERADGFALNVANFETTASNLQYGRAISDRLGGAHFVIDTGRNGNGVYPDWTSDKHWCNPPGRKLGEAPTTRTGQPRVDAYLWVKRPGESDGACGGGAPAAGVWWTDYALALAKA